jgi:hypothetical protein
VTVTVTVTVAVTVTVTVTVTVATASAGLATQRANTDRRPSDYRAADVTGGAAPGAGFVSGDIASTTT